MHNFNVLFSFPDLRIILLNDESMIYLLVKEICHHIHIDSELEGPHCGLVPIGAPSSCTTTTGLKWNLGMCESTPRYFSFLTVVWYIVELEHILFVTFWFSFQTILLCNLVASSVFATKSKIRSSRFSQMLT